MIIRKWVRELEYGVAEHDFCGGKVVVASHRCPGKESENEDAALLVEFAENHGILAVADGMGGHSGGDRAAAAVIDALTEKCGQWDSADNSVRSLIVDAFESANRQIMDWGIGAGTTVVVAEYIAAAVRIIHVGDSTALLCSNRGRIKHYTVAHAPVAQAVELGIIDEQSALDHAERNIVNNHVGDAEMRVEVGPAMKMAKRDTLTLASDGLFDNLTQEEAVGFLRAGQLVRQSKEMFREVQHRMKGRAEISGKPDDCTFIVFRQG